MWFRTKWVVLWSLWAARLARVPTQPLRVTSGELRGSISPDGLYAQYLGIPYATILERFQAPGPAPKWDGMFEAINENIRCTQLGLFAEISVTNGRDDCLVLNVYTPLNMPPSTQLPVMVFIHGGCFATGSNYKLVYGPDYLIDKGVILVTINYRIHIDGFLNLGIKEAPGNTGMKDQVAALMWVQKNIRVFGGDPDNVTIFGESAGGASVSYHILSPMSKGLFHKAIIQSGSSLASWAFQHDPFETALFVAKVNGYNGSSDPYDHYKFFTSKTAYEIVSRKLPRKEGDVMLSEYVLAPCLEKVFDGVEPFLTESPYKILSEGRFNKVPLIIGANNYEGIFFAEKEWDEDLERVKLEEALPRNLVFSSDEEQKRIADEVRKMYMGDDEIGVKSKGKLSEFLGEPFFNYHVAEETSLIVKTSDKPVFSYLFEYDGWRNMIKLALGSRGTRKLKGATHADELFYLFSQFYTPSMFEGKMINAMSTMWTDFAKYGDPTPEASNPPVKWPAVKKEDQRALIIDQQFSIGPIWQDRLLFWKEVYAMSRR